MSLTMLVPPQAQRDNWFWATVTQASPLRIRLDGESTALPFTPDTLVSPLSVGNRVWAAFATNDDPAFVARRIVIVGKTGGVKELDTLPYAKLQRLAAQTLVNNTNEQVDWDTVVRDTHSGWNVSNPSLYTSQAAGEYDLSGIGSWSANSSNRRAVHVLLNGAELHGSQIIVTAQAVGATSLFWSTSVYLAVGHYVEVNLWHNAGIDLTTATLLPAPTVNIKYIRP